MFLIDFPNPRFCQNSDGVVCVSEIDFLNPSNLLHAYKQGIFPWMIEGYDLVPWFCPPERAIIEFAELHIPKSLAKTRKRTEFSFTIDKAFDDVVYACAKVSRNGQRGTWITQDIYDSYNELHRLGFAHSVEVWENDSLVGGLYGVDAGGVFCGESMFHLRSDASKLAFLHLADHLKTRGADWLDIQVMTPHFQILGAKEIPRDDFLQKLEHTLASGLKLF
ncbi:MAG: leucyl/phenylalanyl-tRNA--protein transferase [Pyrinomonadaceae bacterium]|nr:leucyl/phenylalanyl-tRNA--protein transferase [Pyrinomonadaceae bacterium]